MTILKKTLISLVLLITILASVMVFPAAADTATAIIDTGLTPGAEPEAKSAYSNLTLGDSGSEVLNLQRALRIWVITAIR